MAQKEVPQNGPMIPQHKQMAQGRKDQVPAYSCPSPYAKGKKK